MNELQAEEFKSFRTDAEICTPLAELSVPPEEIVLEVRGEDFTRPRMNYRSFAAWASALALTTGTMFAGVSLWRAPDAPVPAEMLVLNANGGIGTGSYSVRDAEEIILSDYAEPTRDGYRFIGWYDNPYAGGQAEEEIEIARTETENGVLVLYAGWERNRS